MLWFGNALKKFSINDLVDRLIVLDKIEKGQLEVKEGKVISHETRKKE